MKIVCSLISLMGKFYIILSIQIIAIYFKSYLTTESVSETMNFPPLDAAHEEKYIQGVYSLIVIYIIFLLLFYAPLSVNLPLLYLFKLSLNIGCIQSCTIQTIVYVGPQIRFIRITYSFIKDHLWSW